MLGQLGERPFGVQLGQLGGAVGDVTQPDPHRAAGVIDRLVQAPQRIVAVGLQTVPGDRAKVNPRIFRDPAMVVVGMRGTTFEGNRCGRCGSTTRYVATKRCADCQRRYCNQHRASRDDREAMRGQPCAICDEPMTQPCFDEVGGERRGWLCHHCNIGLGQFRERADLLFRAIDYLTSARLRS